MFINFLLLNNIHFALTILTALAFFAVGWLYFDTGQAEKRRNILLKNIGFFLLALTWLTHAITSQFTDYAIIINSLKVLGLILLLISLISEPILKPPFQKKGALALVFLPSFINPSLVLLSAILLFILALLFWQKAEKGLEKQLKPLVFSLLCFAAVDLLHFSYTYSDTSIVFWANVLSQYGPVWIIQHLFQLAGTVVLGLWAYGYIRFRLHVQLFLTTLTSSVIIFLLITAFFTVLLLKNLENDALNHLQTDVRVMQYSLETLQAKALDNTRSITLDNELKEALSKKDKEKLYKITSKLMALHNSSFLTVASSSGQVLMRAENKDQTGDTLSEDPLIKSAASGQPLSAVSLHQESINPSIRIEAAVPIKDSDKSQITGIVITGTEIDDAFVDGVKEVTGLDATVFAGNKRTATTFITPDGKSRFTGTEEINKTVLKTVLEEGKIYAGSTYVFNQPFYAAYSPLKSADNKVIGMLFVGKPQDSLKAVAEKSISLTFMGSGFLILLSVIPSYLFSRFLKKQMEA